MPSASGPSKNPGGRPPKFLEPTRPVTVTLPDRTLDQLRRVDEDRAKAIVKAVDAVAGRGAGELQSVEVVEMAPGTGLLLVPPSRILRSIPWLKLIEVAPTRCLLTIVPGTPIERVEIALLDLIDDARQSAPDEVLMLESLRAYIGKLRRSERITTGELLFVAMSK